MEVQSKALELLEKNKGREHLILDKNILEPALFVEMIRHNEYGLMDLAIILSLSKQLKRKVIFKKKTGFTCPSCNNMRFWRDGHYCKDCGQHLDWNYEEEVNENGSENSD